MAGDHRLELCLEILEISVPPTTLVLYKNKISNSVKELVLIAIRSSQ